MHTIVYLFLITYMYQHSAHKWYFNVIIYLLLQIARNTTVTNLYTNFHYILKC